MFQVVKRDGEIAEFQMAKITSAIDKAFDAKEKNYSKDMIDLWLFVLLQISRIRYRMGR